MAETGISGLSVEELQTKLHLAAEIGQSLLQKSSFLESENAAMKLRIVELEESLQDYLVRNKRGTILTAYERELEHKISELQSTIQNLEYQISSTSKNLRATLIEKKSLELSLNTAAKEIKTLKERIEDSVHLSLKRDRIGKGNLDIVTGRSIELDLLLDEDIDDLDEETISTNNCETLRKALVSERQRTQMLLSKYKMLQGMSDTTGPINEFSHSSPFNSTRFRSDSVTSNRNSITASNQNRARKSSLQPLDSPAAATPNSAISPEKYQKLALKFQEITQERNELRNMVETYQENASTIHKFDLSPMAGDRLYDALKKAQLCEAAIQTEEYITVSIADSIPIKIIEKSDFGMQTDEKEVSSVGVETSNGDGDLSHPDAELFYAQRGSWIIKYTRGGGKNLRYVFLLRESKKIAWFPKSIHGITPTPKSVTVIDFDTVENTRKFFIISSTRRFEFQSQTDSDYQSWVNALNFLFGKQQS